MTKSPRNRITSADAALVGGSLLIVGGTWEALGWPGMAVLAGWLLVVIAPKIRPLDDERDGGGEKS